MVVMPLYKHVSEETAYQVDDYPFGFRLRCKIRYYIESHPKKGFRFISQTTNPKKAVEVWNAPKKSTYVLLAACMYLDEQNHVQWSGLSVFTEPEKFLEFLQTFPDIELSRESKGQLQYWVAGKIAICKVTLNGEAVISIGGKPCLPTERDIEEAKKNLECWEKSKTLLLPKF